MLACSSLGALSIRQASMEMSNVAPEKARKRAPTIICVSPSEGSLPAMVTRPSTVPETESSIHDRRWPSFSVSQGKSTRSMIGAQMNLNE